MQHKNSVYVIKNKLYKKEYIWRDHTVMGDITCDVFIGSSAQAFRYVHKKKQSANLSLD